MVNLSGWGVAPAGEVWHFSENPAIRHFRPHVAATASKTTPYVWACDGPRCPDYWFARDTPRAMAWRTPVSDTNAADRLLGEGVQRLHVIEFTSVATMADTRLFAYRFDAAGFQELDGFARVSQIEQTPLGPPVALPSPWQLHAEAGIPVVVVSDLFDWWARVVRTDLGFSGIRLRNSANYRQL